MYQNELPVITASDISYASSKLESYMHFYTEESLTSRDMIISKLVEQINIDNVLEHLNNIVRIRNPEVSVENLNKTAEYIKNTMRSYGMKTSLEKFRFKKVPNVVFSNVFGDKVSENSDKMLIISSHYDSHKVSPGADDNASSVAAMLEIARIVSNLNTEFTIRFAFFTLEEYSMMGSYYHVRNIKKENRTRIIGSICLDGIGYISTKPNSQKKFANSNYPSSNKGNFMAMISNEESELLLRLFIYNTRKFLPGLKTEVLMVKGKGLEVPDSRRSDHSAFWDHGYKAIMITDTCQFRNPYIHTSEDTIDKLDPYFLLDITKVVTSSVLDLSLGR